MSIDHPKVAGAPSRVAAMRKIAEETPRTIAASQGIFDGIFDGTFDRSKAADAVARVPAQHPPESAADEIGLLEGVADGLIVAYEYAKRDDDPLTLALIEKAMLQVGRRLARAIGPRQAGLARH